MGIREEHTRIVAHETITPMSGLKRENNQRKCQPSKRCQNRLIKVTITTTVWSIRSPSSFSSVSPQLTVTIVRSPIPSWK